ncbi:MAG: LexA family protein [Pseudomonadota bacterium]
MTRLDLAVLDYVRTHIERTGVAPTIREIGAAVGKRGIRVIYDSLDRLVAAGKLERARQRTRGLSLVDAPDLTIATTEALKAELGRRGVTGAAAAWRRGTPAAKERVLVVEPVRHHAPVIADDDWTKSAILGSRAYLAALERTGGHYAPGAAMIDDADAPRPALSRDPCPRCGMRGDIGCRHRRAMQEPWR